MIVVYVEVEILVCWVMIWVVDELVVFVVLLLFNFIEFEVVEVL